MTLRLSIENVASLSSGDPVEVTLQEHGMVIGRAAHADWTLPDPANHVSSIHCEIDYRDGRYFLTDRSTNGTFINGAGERLTKPIQLRDGDLVQIGHYQLRVEENPDGTGRHPASGATAAFGGGIDWAGDAGGAAKPMGADAFGRPAARPLFQTAQDPLMAAFAPPAAAPRADPFGTATAGSPPADPFGIASAAPPARTPAAPDPFGIAPAPAPASPPPAPACPPPAAAASDPFGMVAAPAPARGDPFGVPAAPSPDPFGMPAASPDPFAAPARPAPVPVPVPAPATDPFGMANAFAPAPAAPATPPASALDDPWAMLGAAGSVNFGAPPAPPPPPPAPVAPASAPVAPPPPVAAPASAPADESLYARLLAAVGLDRRDMGGRTPESVVDTVGQLLRQTADGLFRLLEARTRVRHQFGVGAQVTTFQRAGNNPLKWTRSPEQALKQMIGEPGAGFLPGEQAVRGAFEDLQAHEMAMIAAMQEAMQETIRRFAPETIRGRIGARGWLNSVLPGSREATLWRAYESEFSAFADESEAAYLDLFARQFKKAYERLVSTDAG